jgi:hypothetical protein
VYHVLQRNEPAVIFNQSFEYYKIKTNMNLSSFARAKEALDTACARLKPELEADPIMVVFEGIKSFRNRVVFADVKEGPDHERLKNLSGKL